MSVVARPWKNEIFNKSIEDSTPVTDYELASRLKRVTFPILYGQMFAGLVHRTIYTDESKTEARVGPVAISLNVTLTCSLLPIAANMISAELRALHVAVNSIRFRNENELAIFSYFASSLQYLDNRYSKGYFKKRRGNHQSHSNWSHSYNAQLLNGLRRPCYPTSVPPLLC